MGSLAEELMNELNCETPFLYLAGYLFRNPW